ncbi:rCG58672, partial [Rattus norvegicus]
MTIKPDSRQLGMLRQELVFSWDKLLNCLSTIPWPNLKSYRNKQPLN